MEKGQTQLNYIFGKMFFFREYFLKYLYDKKLAVRPVTLFLNIKNGKWIYSVPYSPEIVDIEPLALVGHAGQKKGREDKRF
jgi:hypothetical protein